MPNGTSQSTGSQQEPTDRWLHLSECVQAAHTAVFLGVLAAGLADAC